MKTILILLLIPFIASAQKSEIVIDSTKTKAELFSQTLIFIAQTWKSANDVIQLKDEASGVIIVKGGLSSKPVTMGVTADGMTWTDLTFTVKDGKVKIEFSNTRFSYYTGTTWTTEKKPAASGKSYDKWKESVLLELDTMIADYKKHLQKDSGF